MPMSADAAHTEWWQVSELVFGIPLLAGLLLQWATPLQLPQALALPALVSGAVLSLVGVALIVLARREFARHGQHTDPGHPTGQIMTTGVFSFSRNPLYLGATTLWMGVGLLLDPLWMLLLLIPTLISCQVILIAPEERYLEAKFGAEYHSYATTVRRWIGRRRPLG